jgi:hypothetical protein
MGDLKRTFRKTNGARPLPDAFVVIQQHNWDTLKTKVQSGGHPNGPSTNYNHRVPNRSRRILIGAAFVRVQLERQLVAVI